MKTDKVAKVYYETESNNGRYDHPSIRIYDGYDYSLPENHHTPTHKIVMQRHLVEGHDPENRTVATHYNPGRIWSQSYCAQFEEKKMCVNLLDAQLKFVKKINRVIETYNLRYIANDDELHVTVLALEKLKYNVQLNPNKDV